MPSEIELEVNGEMRRVQVEPDDTLLEVLRNELELTAAKLGCALEQCHACAVIVDGELVTSCTARIDSIGDRAITTLEGIGDGERLHPVQQAIIEEEAAQCGYCIPGIIMGAVQLLERNGEPSKEEIRQALDPHLCRCGSHARIIRAVARAARES